MDQSSSSVFSAAIAAAAALSGSFLTLLIHHTSEHKKWVREQTKAAYSNSLRSLAKATIIPIGINIQDIAKWFDQLSEVRESLTVLQIYCSENRERIVERSRTLFNAIDENNFASLATTASTFRETDGDLSGMVLIGVGKIKTEVVAALQDVTTSARLDLKFS